VNVSIIKASIIVLMKQAEHTSETSVCFYETTLIISEKAVILFSLP
jgi:hypothetical protein